LYNAGSQAQLLVTECISGDYSVPINDCVSNSF
jgi:hypothetical protein